MEKCDEPRLLLICSRGQFIRKLAPSFMPGTSLLHMWRALKQHAGGAANRVRGGCGGAGSARAPVPLV